MVIYDGSSQVFASYNELSLDHELFFNENSTKGTFYLFSNTLRVYFVSYFLSFFDKVCPVMIEIRFES